MIQHGATPGAGACTSVTRVPTAAVADRSWRRLVPHAAVKISPAVDYGELPREAEVEFIPWAVTCARGCCGMVICGGAADVTPRCCRPADTLAELDYPGTVVAVTAPRAFLYEPDGAVIRAHLVQTLARRARCDAD